MRTGKWWHEEKRKNKKLCPPRREDTCRLGMAAHVMTPSRDSRARVEHRGVCSEMVRVCWKGGARWELVRMLLVLLSLTSTSTSSTQDSAARSSPTTAGAGGRCFGGKGGAGMSGEKGNRNGAERVGVFLRGASTNPKVGQRPENSAYYVHYVNNPSIFLHHVNNVNIYLHYVNNVNRFTLCK
jgi:hypothetical protein